MTKEGVAPALTVQEQAIVDGKKVLHETVTDRVLLLYYKQIIGLFATRAILAGMIYVIAGFGVGYLLGWPERGTRLAMAYMHGARSASVAVMVANDVFRDQPNVTLMIALVVILILVILIPVSYLFRIKPSLERAP